MQSHMPARRAVYLMSHTLHLLNFIFLPDDVQQASRDGCEVVATDGGCGLDAQVARITRVENMLLDMIQRTREKNGKN